MLERLINLQEQVMYMTSRVRGRPISTKACLEKNAFYQPKKLALFSLMAFILAFLSARTFYAIQRAGLIGTGPNVIGDFHLHHWAYSLIALSILILIAFIKRDNKKIFGACIILISFFLGLFIDGIVYYNSPIFFE